MMKMVPYGKDLKPDMKLQKVFISLSIYLFLSSPLRTDSNAKWGKTDGITIEKLIVLRTRTLDYNSMKQDKICHKSPCR